MWHWWQWCWKSWWLIPSWSHLRVNEKTTNKHCGITSWLFWIKLTQPFPLRPASLLSLGNQTWLWRWAYSIIMAIIVEKAVCFLDITKTCTDFIFQSGVELTHGRGSGFSTCGVSILDAVPGVNDGLGNVNFFFFWLLWVFLAIYRLFPICGMWTLEACCPEASVSHQGANLCPPCWKAES